MTRDEALELMWKSNTWPARNYAFKIGAGPDPGPMKDIFMWAELTEPVDMRQYDSDDNVTVTTAPAGTKVLVTIYSRLGNVGIRAHNVDTPCHGYSARVDPKILINWKVVPSHETLKKK